MFRSPDALVFPPRLSDFDVYVGLGRRAQLDEMLQEPDETPGWHLRAKRGHRYAPKWSLWTNGAHKIRDIVLPEGARVSRGANGDFVFPENTLVFKSFAYLTPESPQIPVPVETRVLRFRAGRWDAAVYRWNAALSDASLLDSNRPSLVPVETADGATFSHEIPSRFQCTGCHDSNDTFIIGVNELQLNWTEEGDERSQLDRLWRDGALGFRLPDPAARITGDSLTTEVKGYLYGNCRHCHNGRELFDLSPEALPGWIGRPGSRGATMIDPGHPERSLLYTMLAGGGMPPLGVQVPDSVKIDMIRRWIEQLVP